MRRGSTTLAIDLGIPTSTASSWLRRGVPANVVTLPAHDDADGFALSVRVRKLERQVRVLVAVIVLLRTAVRLARPNLDLSRIPDAENKRTVLRAIRRASRFMPRDRVFKILGLSAARIRDWNRRELVCQLDDRPSCPVTRPARLTAAETMTIKTFVVSNEHRHFSIRALALHAQRVGAVVASPATWGRLIRVRGWRRPTTRVHPEKPTIGVRATRPNEIWHVDVSIVRLVDGTRVYLQAIIDNWSRKILAFRVSSSFDGSATARLLTEAAHFLPATSADDVQLFADAGVENLNATVDAALAALPIRRVLAQVDVTFSNSMIEGFWRSLKHRWLFLHELDSLASVTRLVVFYVQQHNEVVPHSAFRGHTPDEMFFATEIELVAGLDERRRATRRDRIEANRNTRCGICPRVDARPPGGAGE